jgi:hypothetical protein
VPQILTAPIKRSGAVHVAEPSRFSGHNTWARNMEKHTDTDMDTDMDINMEKDMDMDMDMNTDKDNFY